MSITKRKKKHAILKRFAPALKRTRRDKHWTLRSMAKRAEMPHSALYYMELGRKDPRLTELAQLSLALGSPITIFPRSILLNGRPKKS